MTVSLARQDRTYVDLSGTRVRRFPHGRTPGFNVTFSCDLNVTVLEARWQPLAGPACMDAGGNIGSTPLPTTGTYTIVVDPCRRGDRQHHHQHHESVTCAARFEPLHPWIRIRGAGARDDHTIG